MPFLSEERNIIPKSELIEHVGLNLLKDRNLPVPEIANLSNANIIKKPLTIYDINGKPLFHDFTLKRGKKTLGTVRTIASKILGRPVIRYQLGESRLNILQSISKADAKLKKMYPKSRISQRKIVCYSYPKLGLMYQVLSKREKERVILDIPTLNKVPEAEKDLQREGAFAWSFYDAITENQRTEKLNVYKKYNERRLEAPKELLENLKFVRTLNKPEILSYAETFIPLILYFYGRKLQFCSHYNKHWGWPFIYPSSSQTSGHHCFILHAQEKWDYCAVATCQMILCYYRYYYSQDDIAPHLNYSSGGCPADQSPGYESLTNNHLDATFDSSPTWAKAKQQIDELKPLKSGISNHARAIAGYYTSNFGGVTSNFVYVYDPSPWNADLTAGGQISWENWDSIPHTNFIYTDLQY